MCKDVVFVLVVDYGVALINLAFNLITNII